MSGAARSFIDKQLGRESAYRLLPLFAQGLRQAWLPAWVGLLGEIDETAFERSDPRVAQTKLAWWAGDLLAGSRAQHPLSRQLLGAPAATGIDPAHWQQLAEAALALSRAEASPPNWAAARALWQPLAEAVAALESALCGTRVEPALVQLQWQRQRLWHALLLERPEQGLATLAWQSDVRSGSAARAWADFAGACGELLDQERSARPPLHRALLRSQWDWRLPRLQRGRPAAALLAPPAPVLLWRSWRAAVKVSRS